MLNSFTKGVLVALAVFGSSALDAEEYTLEVCREKARQGDAEALWQMGQRLEAGREVRRDKLKAVSFYRKAAERKHRAACERLAEMYEKGLVVGRDCVMAAQYRAMAEGRSGEVAAEREKSRVAREQFDEIEVALDYIIGRNGKVKDPKTGIRMLYQVGKDKPVAQRVFVQRWEEGDLDSGLSALSTEEWSLILPWFKTQFERGLHKGGMVLGNDAYRRKDYQAAVRYWTMSGRAGLAKSWYLLGNFYACSERNGGGPKAMRSDLKAEAAYRKCLALDESWLDARVGLGVIYLYGDKGCRRVSSALRIFTKLAKEHPKEKVILYYRGMAGMDYEDETFLAKWPNYKRVIERGERSSSYRGRRSWSLHDVQVGKKDAAVLNRMRRDYAEVMERKRKLHLPYLEKASELDYEPATQFLRDWNEKYEN